MVACIGRARRVAAVGTLLTVWLFLCSATVTACPPPAPLHVDGSTGDDANDGCSPSTSLRTIKHAALVAQTGQTILVAPTTVYNGTSNSQVVISTKVLSIKSAVPGTYVRIVCPFSPTPPEALPGGHPFPEPGVPTGAGIVFTNGALNSSLEWFWFHGCSAGGVHLEGSRNVVALNHVKFSDCARYRTSALLVALASPTLRYCEFLSNAAKGGIGGAIDVFDGTISIMHSYFQNNSAFGGAAISTTGSRIWIYNSTFHSNIAQGSAGALHAETSSVFAEQVEFYNNSAIEGSGGALFLTRSHFLIRNCTFHGNSAGGGGGAMLSEFSPGQPTRHVIDNSLFNFNSANVDGGAVSFILDAAASVSNSSFTGNRAPQGGAISVGSRSVVEVKNSVVDGNFAGNGAASFSENKKTRVTWENCSLTNNVAQSQGGALFVDSGSQVSVFGGVISNNTAHSDGGAVCAGGSVYVALHNITLCGNRANANGGALLSLTEGNVVQSVGCSFSENHAGTRGGAFTSISGAFYFTDCQFDGNSAAQAGGVGYLLQLHDDHTHKYSCDGCSFGTVRPNVAPSGPTLTSSPTALVFAKAPPVGLQSFERADMALLMVDQFGHPVTYPWAQAILAVTIEHHEDNANAVITSRQSYNLTNGYAAIHIELVGDIGLNTTVRITPSPPNNVQQLEALVLLQPVEYKVAIEGCTDSQLPQRIELEHRHFVVCINGELEYVDDVSWYLIMSLTSLAFVGTLAVAAVVYKYRDTPVMKSGSTPFMYTILAGCLLVLGSAYVLCFLDTKRLNGNVRPHQPVPHHLEQTFAHLCNALPMLMGVGFDLILLSLVVKTYRIHRIFNNDGRLMMSVSPVSTSTLLGSMAMYLLFGEVLLNTLWIVTSPLFYDLKVIHNGTEGVEVCMAKHFSVFLYASILPKMLLLVVAVVLTYMVRDVHTAFNESRQVGFAIYNLLICSAATLPLTWFVDMEKIPLFLLQSAGLLLMVIPTLLVLFGPKLHVALLHPERNVRPNVTSDFSRRMSDYWVMRDSVMMSGMQKRQVPGISHSSVVYKSAPNKKVSVSGTQHSKSKVKPTRQALQSRYFGHLQESSQAGAPLLADNKDSDS